MSAARGARRAVTWGLTAPPLPLPPTPTRRLIILRILSNIVYFVGRAISGEDSIEPITGRAKVYAKRCDWLVDHGDALVAEIMAAEGLVTL